METNNIEQMMISPYITQINTSMDKQVDVLSQKNNLAFKTLKKSAHEIND